MSSLRVRAQNKLLNTIGAAKPSKNVQFDMAYAGFEKTQSGAVELDAALRGFIISMRGFHMSAQALVGVIDKVAGDQENSSGMKQFAGEIKASFVKLDGHLLNESVARFEKRVLKPTLGWLARANGVKQQVAAFHEEKMLFDHYTRKVMTLREARDKRATSGKVEKAKDVEKLVRNEQKYAAIANTYAKISEQTITNLREFVDAREEKITPILHRMLEFRMVYAKQVFEESQKLPFAAQNESMFDSVLSKLESLVSSLPGNKGGGAPHDDATQANEADVPVQSFSFESFVGEAPPAIPKEAADSPDASIDHDFKSTAPPPLPPASLATDNPFGQHYADVPPPPPLTSPSSPDGFYFDDFAQRSPPMPPLAASEFEDSPTFQPPPPPPPMPSSSGSAPNSASWDDTALPSKPSAPPFASSFSTMPAGPSSFAANPSSWGAFDDLDGPNAATDAAGAGGGNPFHFQTTFADLHQNALGGGLH